MFKLVANARAWWPVAFAGVTEDGEVVDNRFELRFIVHGEDEFLTLLDEGVQLGRPEAAPAAGEQAEQPKLSALYAGFVEKVAVDWRGVHAENGDPLKFEPANIQAVMNVPGVFKAILQALVACRKGEKDVRLGN